MFDPLPDAARVWLFPLDRTLSDAEADALADAVGGWLPSWQSHGRPVRAEAVVLAGRALAVGAAISPGEINAGVSGCGIDAMQRAVEAALAEAGVGTAPALDVTYRQPDGTWASAPRPAFRRLAREGAVDGATPVLDVTAETVGALRAQGAVRPAADAWTGRAFRLAAPAS